MKVGALAVQMTRHESGLWRTTCPYHTPTSISLTMRNGSDDFECVICQTRGTVLRFSRDGSERGLAVIIADKDRK